MPMILINRSILNASILLIRLKSTPIVRYDESDYFLYPFKKLKSKIDKGSKFTSFSNWILAIGNTDGTRSYMAI